MDEVRPLLGFRCVCFSNEDELSPPIVGGRSRFNFLEFQNDGRPRRSHRDQRVTLCDLFVSADPDGSQLCEAARIIGENRNTQLAFESYTFGDSSDGDHCEKSIRTARLIVVISL